MNQCIWKQYNFFVGWATACNNGEIFGMKLEQCKKPYDSNKTGSSFNFFLALDTRVSIVICHCQTDFDASHLGEV